MKDKLTYLSVLVIFWAFTAILGMSAEAATYYSYGNAAPNLVASWWTNTTGTGLPHPTVFTSAGDVFIIQNGSTMTTTNTWTVAGTIQINTGGILVASNAVANSGTGTMTVAAGATYEHNQNGGIIPTATWNATSTCLVTGITNTVPTGVNQTFGNFTWDCPNQTYYYALAATTMVINGNLEVDNTGSGAGNPLYDFSIEQDLTVGGNLIINNPGVYRVCYDISRVLTIDGNVTINGGQLLLNSSDNTTTAYTGTVNVGGNFSLTGGEVNARATSPSNTDSYINFDGTGTQIYSSGGTITSSANTNTINFTVNSGATLQMGTGTTPAVLSAATTGTNTFTLQSGSTLGITSPAGITSSGTTGNIQVNGARTYNTGANYIYEADAAQVTGNGLPATVNNLTVNTTNTSNVTLTNAVAVNGTLTLSAGDIDASADNLTINNGGSISGGSSSSYVLTGNGSGVGYLVMNSLASGTAYIFPVGTTSYYLPVNLTPTTNNKNWEVNVYTPATTNGVYGGAAFTGASLAQIVNAVWDVKSTTTGAAAITLNWQAGLEGSSFAGFSSAGIGISQYIAGWQNASATSASNTSNYATQTYSSWGAFGVGEIFVPLALNQVNLEALLNSNQTVGLYWQAQTGCAYFSVERSADEHEWSAIGRVSATGNSLEISSYVFTDQKPLGGISYYRLEWTDSIGTPLYSETKAIENNEDESLRIYPNPARSTIQIAFGGPLSSHFIRLFNPAGQVIQETRVEAGTNTVVSISIDNYPAGCYFLQMSGPDSVKETRPVLILK